MTRPIIQGGMGLGISTSFLARRCSMNPNVLGTASGVAAEKIMARILQKGDLGGHMRRALSHFPFPLISERIIGQYFIEGGKREDQGFKLVPAFNLNNPRPDLIELAVAANFAFVWLAKQNNPNPISINYLEKMQIPHIYSLTGAMLAGVDYVTMGAGITLQIPPVLEALSHGETASYNIYIEGSKNSRAISFNPREFFGKNFPTLRRPGSLPIISSDVLATLMAKRLPRESIQGFVVELPTAGGHNAPPREKGVFNESGEPVYGLRDEVSFEKLVKIRIPFWLGGSFSSPALLAKARSFGAVGIQVGSIFALCENSGMNPFLRRTIRRLGFRNELIVRTDPKASPTGYPIKVVQLEDSLSSSSTFDRRVRKCDLKGLAAPCEMDDGSLVFRCPAEPLESYILKGGKVELGEDARCLCNGLLVTADLGSPGEPPIVTIGDDVSFLPHLMEHEKDSYTVEDAIAYLLQ